MQEKNMGHICPIGRSGVKLNNSEKHRLSLGDIFFGNTRHLYEKNELTLGSSGGGGAR